MKQEDIRNQVIPNILFAFMVLALLGLSGCRSERQAPPPAQGLTITQPAWWNDGVFYEVFVRSFYDSDGDGIGDLNGLIEKLDYLNDGDPATTTDLGVTGIWLMPIMESPSYHGYDTTDYYAVEGDYGRQEDFTRLIEEAHGRGIKVIIDLMLNHTSNQHPWFIAAASSPESGQRDWYVWRRDDPKHKSPWGAPVWYPLDNWYYHALFWEGMPDLNFRNPEVTQEMYEVARFWLEDMGVDGFRLDAVRHLIEKDGNYTESAETHQWLSTWDDFVDQVAPQALTVGEVWDESTVSAPYVQNGETDIAFEFNLAHGIITSINDGDPYLFGERLAQVLTLYPAGQYAPFLTNHDQNRVMSQFGQDVAKSKLAATLLLTLPGVPFIYYGEEIGMVGEKPDEMIRTPMQWRAVPGAGFTSGQPWEKVNDDYEQVNVAAQESDPQSMLSHYRRLIHLRGEQPALRLGSLQSLESTCESTYAYLRHLPDNDHSLPLLVVINFSHKEQRNCAFNLAASELVGGSRNAIDLLTGRELASVDVAEDGRFADYVPLPVLAPRQGAILELQSKLSP